jgi:hypothetical protein
MLNNQKKPEKQRIYTKKTALSLNTSLKKNITGETVTN